MPDSPTAVAAAIEAFLARWFGTERAERANKDLFLTELCDLLDLPHPDPAGRANAENAYVFERAVPLHQPDGRATTGKIDLYRRGCFVLEAKQTAAEARPENAAGPFAAQTELGLDLRSSAETGPQVARRADPYGRAMLEARSQAERYARNLPASEPPPSFLVVLDVGHSFELFADFTQKGKAFLPFPDARSHRVLLTDLRDERIRHRLRALWLDPLSLDPAKASADVTRKAARHLAELAKSFEQAGHAPRVVAAFLTRCLFCMFAEDVGLLPRESFRRLLEDLQRDRAPATGVAATLETLFRELDRGTPFSTVLRVKLLHFNGGLFADSTALPVDGHQFGLLLAAARLQWRDVEPAIFGTLLERALDPAERHKLGAHYTPRAYVERLVLPTVIEPLRTEWDNVLAAAISHAERGRKSEAEAAVFRFHRKLCSTRVLDPACGSGNFLYVTLAHFKLLEGEVLDAHERFGGIRRTEQGPRAIGAETVDPHQFLGLELNPRAAAIAELVLWIGYLQWHFRTLGAVAPAEPVLRNFKNIEHRDAVLRTATPPRMLTWGLAAHLPFSAFAPPEISPEEIEKEAKRRPDAPITVWDKKSYCVDPDTGKEVPDLDHALPVFVYEDPKAATWPDADYIVGNPPFLGNKRMRADLGDNYVEALRAAYPALPQDIDFVMYWWDKAADLVHAGKLRRFGFITTNSIRQSSNRAILARHLSPGSTTPPLSLRFAIPDHPWVDTEAGAAVRISMTVADLAGTDPTGELVAVISERPNHERLRELRFLRTTTGGNRVEEDPPETMDERNDDGSLDVTLARNRGKLAADLSLGADMTAVMALKANRGLSFMGVTLGGDFTLTIADLAGFGLKAGRLPPVVRPFLIGQDLNQLPRGRYVIDFSDHTSGEARATFSSLFERISRLVRPQRAQHRNPKLRCEWWSYERPREDMRRALAGLPRYIATCRTAKHRLFTFVPGEALVESTVIAIASADPFHLGVLSSRIHTTYSLAAGSRLGIGNDPRYNNSLCFEPFPFPAATKPQAERIRSLAEELDTHRKRAQAQHGVGLTAIYNVLGKLQVGEVLSVAERNLHDRAFVSTLKPLHDELDAAVAAAYGWRWPLDDEAILDRLVALNAARAAEEAQGKVRWLRPDFQAATQGDLLLGPRAGKAGKPRKGALSTGSTSKKNRAKSAWPKERPAQVEAVATVLRAATEPVTAADLAAKFARAKKDVVAEILAALVVLGRAHKGARRGTFTA